MDYEQINALAWDDSLVLKTNGQKSLEETESQEWTVVSSAKHRRQQITSSLEAKTSPVDRKKRKALQASSKPSVDSKQQKGKQECLARSLRHDVAGQANLVPTDRKTHRGTCSQNGDIDARALWSMHKPPETTVRIEATISMHDKTYERICNDLGTFIHMRDAGELKTKPHSYTFGIWGTLENTAQAKAAVLAWIREQPRIGTQKFAKLISQTPSLRMLEEKRWRRDVRKMRFRQHPPISMAFAAIGHFHWPIHDHKPDAFLGKGYEGLDSIRMKCDCFIVWVPEELMFRVMGADIKKVKTALCSIRAVCFQISARFIAAVKLHTLRWPVHSKMVSQVCLDSYHRPAVIFPRNTNQGELEACPRGEGLLLDSHETEIARKTAKIHTIQMKETLSSALRRLHFYQGGLQLRLHYGRFLLHDHSFPKENVMKTSDYLGMTRASQFRGAVSREIGDKVLEDRVLQTLRCACDFLQPHDIALLNDLAAVKPIYTATFVFEDPTGVYQLVMTWQEESGGNDLDPSVQLTSEKWAILGPAGSTSNFPTQLATLSKTDLSSGSAWVFELSGTYPVNQTRLPQHLASFPSMVKVAHLTAAKQNPNKRFVFCTPIAALRRSRQAIRYRYLIQETDYTLEISKFHDTTYLANGVSVTEAKPIVYESRWSLDVYRIDWDTMFSRNSELAAGKRADWNDDFAHWFPKDIPLASGPNAPSQDDDEEADGFMQLLRRLDKIEYILRSRPALETVVNLVEGLQLDTPDDMD